MNQALMLCAIIELATSCSVLWLVESSSVVSISEWAPLLLTTPATSYVSELPHSHEKKIESMSGHIHPLYL